jgi:hypothetical protein
MTQKELPSACKIGQAAAFGTIEFTTKLGHHGLKTDRHTLDANVLIGAIVVAMAGWICLRKECAASRSAIWAAQAFRPLVAFLAKHAP